MYERIYEDEDLETIYAKIEKFEDETKGPAYHNWNHVSNVTNMVENILTQLGETENYIEAAKIASILHDTGAIEGKENHAFRSKVFAEDYFRKKNLNPNYLSQILYSIENHSNGFEAEELMTLTLILSDKLDITKIRVAKEGHNIIDMRQLQYISDIEINFIDVKFIVNFITTENLNLMELNEFAFMKKVYKAIDSFSNKLELTPVIQFNGYSI